MRDYGFIGHNDFLSCEAYRQLRFIIIELALPECLEFDTKIGFLLVFYIKLNNLG
jgi:hypothetical protein